MFSKHKYGDKKGLILLTLFIFIAGALGALMTYAIGTMIDLAMNKDLAAMNELAIQLILLATGSLLIALTNAFIESRWLAKSMNQLKQTYVDGLLNQEVIALQKDKIPQMTSTLTNDFDRYETKYIRNIPQIIGMLSQFIFAMILLSVINPYLMIIPLIMLLFFWKRSKNSSKPIKVEEKKKSESLATYTGFVTETLTGYEIIKQHQMEETREKRFHQLASIVQQDNYNVDVQTTKVEAINSLLIFSMLFGFLIGGLLLAKQSNVSFGNIMIVFSAFGQVIWPIQRTSQVLAEMRGIEDVLKTIDLTLQKQSNTRTEHVNSFESLLFNSNSLGYEDQIILKDVNLVLNNQEKILIIGPSGAGKSTILKTLRQTIQAQEGVVTLNGHDILSIDIQDYFSKFASVDQIGFIFNGSLKENITLYQKVSDEKVRHTMNQVGLSDLDLELAVLNDGGNLSGGQRARVLLARALSLEAQIIVCDEIFASLDANIAEGIEKDLLHLETTVINVSHIYFESNLSLYDRIYIVENQTIKVASNLQEVKDRLLEVSSPQ